MRKQREQANEASPSPSRQASIELLRRGEELFPRNSGESCGNGGDRVWKSCAGGGSLGMHQLTFETATRQQQNRWCSARRSCFTLCLEQCRGTVSQLEGTGSLCFVLILALFVLNLEIDKGSTCVVLQFTLPFLLNQSGSVLYYLLLGSAELSLAVPISNASAFLFTLVVSKVRGESAHGNPTRKSMKTNTGRRL